MIYICAGLGGKTLTEEARVDMIVDCCDDLGAPASVIYQSTDMEKKVRTDNYLYKLLQPIYIVYNYSIQIILW